MRMPGVDRTGAGPHHQSFQGREAHGGGHRQPVANGRRRTPAAQMAGDEAKLSRIAGEHLGRPAGAILVADAVEAEAAHAPTHVPIVGQGVNVCPRRLPAKEDRVEDGHLGRVGQGLLGRADRLQGRRIVQRRQFGQLGECLFHPSVDEDVFEKLGAAVDDPMCDRRDGRKGFVAADLRHGRRRGTTPPRCRWARPPDDRSGQPARPPTPGGAWLRSPSAQSIAPEANDSRASASKRPNFKLLDPALKTRMLMGLAFARPCGKVPNYRKKTARWQDGQPPPLLDAPGRGRENAKRDCTTDRHFRTGRQRKN